MELNTRPAFFIERYIRNEVYLRDPILLAMSETGDTLTWSEAMSWFLWSREARAIVEGARDFGANDGLTMPLFSHGMIAGVFSVCGWNPDLSPRVRARLEVLGLIVHQALMRVGVAGVRRGARHIVLTSRESEVVHWAARNKVDCEIAAILGIRTATVKTLLSSAQQKLGARDRDDVAIRALLKGELRLAA